VSKVAEAKKRLLAAGFVELSDVWEMKAGGTLGA